MKYIESFSNPLVKRIKALSKSRNRKREGVFLLEGRPELDHAIQLGVDFETILFSDHYTSLDEINSLTQGKSMPMVQLSKAVFDDLVVQQVPGNFLALCKSWHTELQQLDRQTDLIVVLESLEKPGNLGAILRTCDAVGIQNVIVANSQIDRFNPNVLRNSRGAAFSVNVSFDTNENVRDYLAQHGFTTYAAALDETSVDYKLIDKGQKRAIVFGAESKGLSNFWLQHADNKVIIPMNGKVDSLNLSVSVGVILYDQI